MGDFQLISLSWHDLFYKKIQIFQEHIHSKWDNSIRNSRRLEKQRTFSFNKFKSLRHAALKDREMLLIDIEFVYNKFWHRKPR